MSKAVFPGSFDPFTNGHLDVIERSAKIFDEIVVAVSIASSDPKKKPLFTLEERAELIHEVTSHLSGKIKTVAFKGLLVDVCRDVGADCVVKGIRAVSDFDYELKQAQMNARMGIDTLFMPTSPEYAYLSSSLMKEVVILGGEISGLVPDVVEVMLKEKLGT
jgi:pantetheine-phosphate adenylyltransferase